MCFYRSTTWYTGGSNVSVFIIFISYNLKDYVIKFDTIAWYQSLLVEIYKIQ